MGPVSGLAAQVQAFLAQEGPLHGELPLFQCRQAQQAMALAVAQTIEEGGCLVAEAGTGIGKTYAYLVPALLSGARVLVSTSTKALQEQLAHRDLPRLTGLLNRHESLHRRVALLKGRANYLCLHRLEQAWNIQEDAGLENSLDDVRLWAQATSSGDVAEIAALDLDAQAVARITSTRENCLGGRCPRFGDCHVYRARRQAAAADVVVVNHALFMADQAAAGDGESDLLAHRQVVVFDEAHSLNAVGQQAFGQQFGVRQLLRLAQDLYESCQQQAPGLRDWNALRERLVQAAQGLLAVCGPLAKGIRIGWHGAAPDGVMPAAWSHAQQELVAALRLALGALDAVAERSPDVARLHQRVVSLLEALMDLSSVQEGGQVRWLDCGVDDVRMMLTPFRSGPSLQKLWQTARPRVPGQEAADAAPGAWDEPEAEMLSPVPDARARAGQPPRSFIFTSATLGTNAALDWFTGPLNLADARVLRLDSPFDYARQAALYIPEQLPAANDPGHAAALAAWLAEPVARLGGRSLVLTTSLRAMDVIADELARLLAGQVAAGRIELLVQGRSSHAWIAQRFQRACEAGADGPGSGCVLVASQLYWQGFDVPGDALQMVVIDKLPFPVPTDPLVQAYSEYLEALGGNPFKDHALQEAAMALRQGAGRLIRSESDSGILVVADARLARGYGKWLQRQLPPMRRLAAEAEFQDELGRLTRTSTTDRPSS